MLYLDTSTYAFQKLYDAVIIIIIINQNDDDYKIYVITYYVSDDINTHDKCLLSQNDKTIFIRTHIIVTILNERSQK